MSLATPVQGSGPRLDERSRLSARRARGVMQDRRRDAVEAAAWLAGTGAIALALASGTLDVSSPSGLLIAGGRLAGIVASTLIMVQLVLIARIPVVERAVGHDRAARLHGTLGRLGFLVMIAHVALLVAGYALVARIGVITQAWELATAHGGPMTLAWIGAVVLIAVVVTSYAAVRRRWAYESWHAVHVFAYLAVGLSIPHQLTDGSTFMAGGFAWWYWAALWTVAVGGLLVFRVARPLVRMRRHRVRVAATGVLADGSTAIAMTGHRLGRLRARGGQFFLFRFLAPGMWGQAHPYSLSRAPREDWMRITVKPLGEGSAALAGLRPGTRVMVEGPFGLFTDAHRRGSHLVLAGAGIGITPVLALLEDSDVRPGECTVIVRAHAERDVPHLDELRSLAVAKGAALHVLVGPRGDGWAPQAAPVGLAQVVAGLAGADVFACGPTGWVSALMDDAARAGVPAERRHSEGFSW